jgi:membrane protein implicated in regulation of membrane protease activity
VRVGDSVWRAEGPDLPAGDRVKVIGVDGAALKVEKA